MAVSIAATVMEEVSVVLAFGRHLWVLECVGVIEACLLR